MVFLFYESIIIILYDNCHLLGDKVGDAMEGETEQNYQYEQVMRAHRYGGLLSEPIKIFFVRIEMFLLYMK